jgi:hypothetical protein
MYKHAVLATLCLSSAFGAIFTLTGPFPLADSPVQSTQFPATTPYPLDLVVSGMGSSLSAVSLSFTLTHTWPDDLHFLLQGPGGETVYVMGNAGSSFDLSNCTLTFSDSGLTLAPDSTALICGSTYQPNSVFGTLEPFAAGTPAGPYGTSFSVFNGTNPNGTWRLYIGDDAAGDSGSLASFSLDITAPADIPEPATFLLTASAFAVLLAVRKRKA